MDQQQVAGLQPPQLAQQSLWDMLQQQQLLGPGHEQHPAASPTLNQALLPGGVLSGKPLSSLPAAPAFQAHQQQGSGSAGSSGSVFRAAFQGGPGQQPAYAGGQQPAGGGGGSGAPPSALQQLQGPGGVLLAPSPVAPLPLSGAALAAAAHLRPPPPTASVLPPAGTAVPAGQGGMPHLQLGLQPSYVQQQGVGQQAALLQQQQQAGSGGASPPPHLPNLTVPMVSVPLVKSEPSSEPVQPSSSHSASHVMGGGSGPSGSQDMPGSPGGSGSPGGGGVSKSRYRGVSYDRKKGKWRVQIKVAALGKSGVSVGYFDTEEGAARAYDRAAIGLLGIDNPNLQTNFSAEDYAGEAIPRLSGKTREEVKTTLKSERIKQAPRRRFTTRQRTSRYMGVGSSNRKNQWQARILVHGKVTHLGYYETEEEAARVYDRVSLALHGEHAQTNFPSSEYGAADLAQFRGLEREDLQRALGVKPMDKSSRFRGVSKKKGKWEAKVMVNRRWAYRELFDSEEEAARAYDRALWRLKPKEAHSYVNFKDQVPQEVAELLARGGEPHPHARNHHRGRGAASSGDDASGQSEEELDSDDEELSGGRSAVVHVQLQSSPASTRPRRAAAMRNSPSKAAAAAAVAAAAAAAVQPTRASPRQAAAAAAAAAQPAPAPAGPGAGGWFGAPAPGAAPGGLGQMRHSGSAPNLAALGAGAFGSSPSAPNGFSPLGGHMGSYGSGVGASGGGASHFSLATSAPMIPTTAGGQPTLPFGQPLPPQVPAPAQPLLVRVGSETHLIAHAAAAARQHEVGAHHHGGGAGAGGGATTLGKRMSRIQSEPHFPTMLDSSDAGDLLPTTGPGAVDLGLLSDRDLFKGIEFSSLPDDGHAGLSSDMALDPAAHLVGVGDTEGLLDFIRELPDINPVSAAAGGMFKSRSAVNLTSLGSLWDEEDAALASLEFSRPKKMSRSMSMRELGGLEEGQEGAAGGARPPLPPNRASPPRGSPSHSSDSGGLSGERLGPLGKPIRRTNTYTASLAPLEEKEERLQPPPSAMQHHHHQQQQQHQLQSYHHHYHHQQHHGLGGSGDPHNPHSLASVLSNSGDDLVTQLLGPDHASLQPHPGDTSMDEALHLF